MNLELQKATRQHTREHNQRLVLRTLYEYGEVSRADLARLTQLTRTTISGVVATLISQNLVKEVGTGPSLIGRSPILLRVVDDARLVASVSLSHTELDMALVSLRGTLRHRTSRSIAGLLGADLIDCMYQSLDELVRQAVNPLLGIGISTPGLVDATRGVVLRAVNFGWKDFPLGELLRTRYQLPVYVANDSHTRALAEYTFGRAHHAPNLVVINVGQGIGAGIVLNGQLFYGDDQGAGEIGHVRVIEHGRRCNCGNLGCLETVADEREIIRLAHEAAAAEPDSALARIAADRLDIGAIARAYQAGDRAARTIIDDTGRYLGIAVANMVGILNIRRIQITGEVARFGLPLRDAIAAEVGRRVLPMLAQTTEIEVAEQGSDTVLLGASALLLTGELGLHRLTRRDWQGATHAA